MPWWPGSVTQHLESWQKVGVTITKYEAVSPQLCQFNQTEIKHYDRMRKASNKISYPRYLTWCWTRAMSKTLGILFSFGLMHRTKWQFLLERVLRRAPSETLNWVPTVAGLLRSVLFEFPARKYIHYSKMIILKEDFPVYAINKITFEFKYSDLFRDKTKWFYLHHSELCAGELFSPKIFSN